MGKTRSDNHTTSIHSSAAVDIGSSQVKALGGPADARADQARTFSIPSVVTTAQGTTEMYGLLAPDTVHLGGQQYVCGSDARDLTDGASLAETRHQDWPETTSWMALLHLTLHKLEMDGNVTLSLGVPQAHYLRLRDAVKKKLQGRNRVKVGDVRRELYLHVQVVPQAAAAALHAIESGHMDAGATRIGVIDIGFFTTGFAVVDVSSARPRFVPRQSGGIKAGVGNLQDEVGRLLATQYNRFPEPDDLDRILQCGALRVPSGEIELTSDLTRIAHSQSDPIIQWVQQHWRDINGMDIILAGGGAAYFASAVRNQLASHARTLPEPAWAVAHGLYLEAQRQAAADGV